MATHQYKSGILNGGEGANASSVLINIIGSVFLISCILRGSSKNGDSIFYMWLAFSVIIPLVVIGNL